MKEYEVYEYEDEKEESWLHAGITAGALFLTLPIYWILFYMLGFN